MDGKKPYVKCDKTASEILTCVHYLAGMLGTTVYVEHVDRVSDGMSYLADELSKKESTKNRKIMEILEETGKVKVESYLQEWLKNPLKGDLCRRLVKETKERLNGPI